MTGSWPRELENVRKTPVVVIVTKCDQVPPERVAEQLVAVADLGEWADVVPVSAVTGFQLDVLSDVLVSHLPEGPALYPDGELTDEPEQIMVAELIREAALEGVRDELPHSIAVVVEEMGPQPGRDDLIDVHAELYVERPSQKAIVIGTGGSRLEVGRQPGPRPDRGPARRQGLPRPARQGRQGLAAQPQAAPPPRLLRSIVIHPKSTPPGPPPRHDGFTWARRGPDMLIIFGLRVFYRTVTQGVFHCRRCGGDRQYRQRAGRRWVTVFFLPLIPLNSVDEHVRCTTCRTRYVTDVLSVPTTAQMQAALPAGMRAAASAMLRSDEPASSIARQRAVEAVRAAGMPAYSETMLNGDLSLRSAAIRPALNEVGAQLAVRPGSGTWPK